MTLELDALLGGHTFMREKTFVTIDKEKSVTYTKPTCNLMLLYIIYLEINKLKRDATNRIIHYVLDASYSARPPWLLTGILYRILAVVRMRTMRTHACASC